MGHNPVAGRGVSCQPSNETNGINVTVSRGVAGRSIEECLQMAFSVGRSPAFISQLLHEAGKRAGEILEKVDHSGLGQALLARDELFVHHRDPILLIVEPHSLVITGLYATADRDAETWGCVLLLTQDRKVQTRGWRKIIAFHMGRPANWRIWMPRSRRMSGTHWKTCERSSKIWIGMPGVRWKPPKSSKNA